MMPILEDMFLESSLNNDTNDIDHYLRTVHFYLSVYGSGLKSIIFLESQY